MFHLPDLVFSNVLSFLHYYEQYMFILTHHNSFEYRIIPHYVYNNEFRLKAWYLRNVHSFDICRYYPNLKKIRLHDDYVTTFSPYNTNTDIDIEVLIIGKRSEVYVECWPSKLKVLIIDANSKVVLYDHSLNTKLKFPESLEYIICHETSNIYSVSCCVILPKNVKKIVNIDSQFHVYYNNKLEHITHHPNFMKDSKFTHQIQTPMSLVSLTLNTDLVSRGIELHESCKTVNFVQSKEDPTLYFAKFVDTIRNRYDIWKFQRAHPNVKVTVSYHPKLKSYVRYNLLIIGIGYVAINMLLEKLWPFTKKLISIIF